MALPERFVVIPPAQLPDELRQALLGEFATREGYDTADTSEQGASGWVDQLDSRVKRGELLIIHDIETETTEIMSKDKWQQFVQQGNFD